MNIIMALINVHCKQTIIHTYWKQSARDHEFCYFIKKSYLQSL